ncbi:uncharacterized protein DS421_7g216610 [Arachis hypogaea]|nr:uncharacterized protein DS421_7g216610 [Arachis hypogaea]
MSHVREPSSSRMNDACERGRSSAAAAIQPASPLSLPLSSPPQLRRCRKLVTLCHCYSSSSFVCALSPSQARLPAMAINASFATS